MGDVGIGTATPGAKLHIVGTPGVDGIMFPDGTKQTTKAVAGGESCLGVPGAAANCFLDVDGDGFTPARDDCDEECPNSFLGFVGGFASPDGRDNNCNGIVDEGGDLSRVCPVSHNLNWAAANSACETFCTGKGTTVASFSCNRLLRGLTMFSAVDIGTCTLSGWGTSSGYVCTWGTSLKCACIGAYN